MQLSARRLLVSGFAAWVAFALLGLWFLLPLKKHLRFGIDLVGGTYITLEVQTDKAIQDELRGRIQTLVTELKNEAKQVPIAHAVEQNQGQIQAVVTFESADGADQAAGLLGQLASDIKKSVDGNRLIFQLTPAAQKQLQEWAVQSNIEVLGSRLNKMSIAEILIAPQGQKNIIVELPDVADPIQAKAMIGKPAILEFKLVEKKGPSHDAILDEYDGQLPPGMEIISGKERSDSRVYYLVPDYAEISGKLLKDARVGFGGQTGALIVVNFEFTSDGGKKFYELTGNNIGRELAIILDGQVISSPVINSAIGSSGQITGNFTSEGAKELAALLKSGAFVAPVTFEEQRQIGATLGQESIKKGLTSFAVGLFLLLLFSLFYYKVAGIFAFLALMFNLLLMLLILAWFGATLTLPGIAGMVLTIGMAIDASILIFEKIKEDLATGMPFRTAVNAGFSDALAVILDANITHLIVGAVLYKFGTGPIQGFAVTLIIGIISTLVSGLFFLKSLFNVAFDAFGVQKIKI